MAKNEPNPADQLLDLFIYAPVGIALEAVDNLPKYIERVKSQITIGRFLARSSRLADASSTTQAR